MVIPVQDPRFISGLTNIDTGYVYTSRGLGVVGLPVRVNCPPEITVIELA
jgi:predicted MPP superfamily phosphohydrolase